MPHPSSRPARVAVRSVSSPYPSSSTARQDLSRATKSRARVSSATFYGMPSTSAPTATASRQVLGEIDWWTIMAGQLPTNSSRTSFASEASSIRSSSAGSYYAASLADDYQCADTLLLSSKGSGEGLSDASDGFGMDIDGHLTLAACTALPASRAGSRPTTPNQFWTTPAGAVSTASLPPSSPASSAYSSPSSASRVSVPSSPATSTCTTVPSVPSSPRRSFLTRAKSFASLGMGKSVGRSRSTSGSSTDSASSAFSSKKGGSLRRL